MKGAKLGITRPKILWRALFFHSVNIAKLFSLKNRVLLLWEGFLSILYGIGKDQGIVEDVAMEKKKEKEKGKGKGRMVG